MVNANRAGLPGRAGRPLAEVLRERVRQCCQYGKISLNAMARRIGVSQPVLFWFMAGRDLRLGTAQKLLDFFAAKDRSDYEMVAAALDLDFVPQDINEGSCAYHEHVWNGLEQTERDYLQDAEEFQHGLEILRGGGETTAAACRVVQKQIELARREAGRIREYMETRLRPYRDKVIKRMAKARAEAKKNGRDRRKVGARASERN
jgi:hypothetical protein